MKKQHLIYCALIVIFGCEKEQLTKEPPEIPAAVKFDLNEDGVDDVLFQIGADDVFTDGTLPYVGYVYPLNEALLMISSENEYSWIFDKQINDTIEKAETKSATWYPSNLGIINIDDTPEGLWPNEWNISGQRKIAPITLVYRLRKMTSIW